MLCLNAPLSPSMAVPISVTVTIPTMMPRVVRAERILFARRAESEIFIPSRISAAKFMQRSELDLDAREQFHRLRSNHREYAGFVARVGQLPLRASPR